jgi:hypothetical protein
MKHTNPSIPLERKGTGLSHKYDEERRREHGVHLEHWMVINPGEALSLHIGGR